MKFLLVFISLSFFHPVFSYAQLLVADVEQNQEFTFEDSTAFFLGHTTRFWDGGQTERVVREMIQLATQNNVKKIATVSDAHLEDAYAQMHYFTQSDIDVLIYSRAGQHRLRFPHLKNIFIMGGNVGRCLCEGIRDIARGVALDKNFQETHFYIVRDGTYNNWPAFAPMKRDAVEGFIERFFVPSFVCPLQNWFDTPRLVLPDVALSLYYDTEWIRDYDLEPSDSTPLAGLRKKIHVHFILSSDVAGILNTIKR